MDGLEVLIARCVESPRGLFLMRKETKSPMLLLSSAGYANASRRRESALIICAAAIDALVLGRVACITLGLEF